MKLHQLVISSSTLLAAIACDTSQAQDGSYFSSFYGAVHPSEYLEGMMASMDTWTKADKELFVRRCLEGAIWAQRNHSDIVMAGDDTMMRLTTMFPEIKGRPAEYSTAWNLAQILGPTHPQIRMSVRGVDTPTARFHTYPSPAALFEQVYSYGGGRFTAREWSKVLRLMREGAGWERKHLNLDFGVSKKGVFMQRVRTMVPGIQVSGPASGIHIRDLYEAVMRSKRSVKLGVDIAGWTNLS